MTDTTCRHCGAEKQPDRYGCCEDCRREWRTQKRKPGSNAQKVEDLRAALADCQSVLADLVELSRMPHVHAAIQPLRDRAVKAEAAARAAIRRAQQ